MPTGYTAMLDDDPEMTTKRWILEGLSRAFGVCVILRDDGDLSEEQITTRLEKEAEGGYYKEALKKAQDRLKNLQGYTDAEWQEAYEDRVAEITERNRKAREGAEARRIRHEAAERDLIKVVGQTDDEVTRNIAHYGLDQLDRVRDYGDHRPLVIGIPSVFEEFKKSTLAAAYRDVNYNMEKLEETKRRERDRLNAYRKVKSEVNRILGDDR